MTRKIDPPFGLEAWIQQNLPTASGAIGNKEVFKNSDFIFQIIKGPNARNDFHIDPWDEIFYQLHGHIFVHVIEDVARKNRVPVDFARSKPVKPTFLGIKSFDDYDLAELVPYIDWTPFFQTWELAGRFPAILKDEKVGEVARSLYNDARKMLDTIVKEKWFRARATIGFWPANAQGDDIVLYSDESRTKSIATLHTLRQQLEKRECRFNAALADFVAPVGAGVPDDSIVMLPDIVTSGWSTRASPPMFCPFTTTVCTAMRGSL